MPYANLQTTFDDTQATSVITQLNAAKALMTFLVNLTKKEKNKGNKMGPKAVTLNQTALKIAGNNSTAIPSVFSVTGWQRDFTAYIALMRVAASLNQLKEGVDDTLNVLLRESTTQASAFYKFMLVLQKQNYPGADEIVNQMKPFFPRSGKMKKALKG